MPRYQAITIGSSTVDIFADTDQDELIEIQTGDTDEELIAYPLGSKIPLTAIRHDVGGNGVNVAVGLSRLDIDTAYAGKLGRDAHGDIIKQRLDDEGVAFAGGRSGKSGMGIILDSHLKDERTILGYKGCNNMLEREDVTDNLHADLWYFSSMLEEGSHTMQMTTTR
ncbi:MAG: carbohydrate kinase family protein [Halobacteriaceae archaeon]